MNNSPLPTGLYELLHTKQLHQRLEKLDLLTQAEWHAIDPEEIHNRLAVPLAREVAAYIQEVIKKTKLKPIYQIWKKYCCNPRNFSSLLSSFFQ